MTGRLEEYALWRKTETVNAWREKVAEWACLGAVRVAISAGTGGGLARTNDLLRIDSTHTGATWDDVRAGDRLRRPEGDDGGTGWEVTYFIDGGRRKMHQLFLKREEDLPDRLRGDEGGEAVP